MLPTLRPFVEMLFGNQRSAWRIAPWWNGGEAAAVEGSVLRLIGIAYAQRRELAPLLTSLSSEHRWLTRRRMRGLAQRLAAGTALVDALEQTPGLISDEAVLELRFAAQSGMLGQTLPTMIDRVVEQNSQRVYFQYRHRGYYVVLAVCTLFAMVFVDSFIAPTYVKLAEEMELPPNRTLSVFNQACQFVYGYAIPMMAIAIVVLAMKGFVAPQRNVRRRLASRLSPSISQLQIAQLLRMLSTASESGRPLAGSLSTLARYHFDPRFRSRLLVARNEMELGAEPWNSLASTQLLTKVEAEAISSSTSTGTRSWLMSRLAEQREERVRLRHAIGLSLVHPLVILALGGLVLWIAFACLGSIPYLTLSLS